MAEAGAEAAGSAVDKVADAELEQRDRSQGASTSGQPHTILEASDAVLQQRTYFVPTMVTQSSVCFSSILLEHMVLQQKTAAMLFAGVLLSPGFAFSSIPLEYMILQERIMQHCSFCWSPELCSHVCVQWVLAFVFGCSISILFFLIRSLEHFAETTCKPGGLHEYA